MVTLNNINLFGFIKNKLYDLDPRFTKHGIAFQPGFAMVFQNGFILEICSTYNVGGSYPRLRIVT